MERLISHINPASGEFLEKKGQYLSQLSVFRNALVKVMAKNGGLAVEKHRERGKLLARERIELLVDPGTPFLELSSLAAWGQYDQGFPSAGIVTGIGLVHGRETVIIANDATVKGGTYISETIKKHLRAQEIAMESQLPCIYLVDSGGVFLPEQSRVFPDKNDFGRIFYNQARLSAMGVPQVSLVMGSCTAGGAYIPAMSDQVVMVRNQGSIFLGGPPLVKAATGEVSTAEELGGAMVHTTFSGVADYIADNDREAILRCRSIFETIPFTHKQHHGAKSYIEPIYDPTELYGILPASTRENVDPREIIMRVVDGSYFDEFKAAYGTTLVTGFAHIMGFPVGIIANFGILFSESALKATHFIELCNFRKIPLLFLQNITGFMVGRAAENNGIAKDGAKMVHTVANAVVPKFTIIFGGSYGAGNYAMAGRAYNPTLLFMYPNATISVMGGEQAANVLLTVKEEQLKTSGKELSAMEAGKLSQEIRSKYETEGSAYYSTSRLWDDGIIDPADTRKIIAMGISFSLNKPMASPKTGIYRM